MEHVDKDPVVGQLIAIAPVDILHPHVRLDLAVGRPPHSPARWFKILVGPDKKATADALGHPAQMPVKHTTSELRAEWFLVLINVAINCLGRAYSR